ncbi:hypothetical protein BU26DRAFT_523791 [Trematosphaeria pertusa]|uniref:Uncharacterized protein n=1 Tax=Trematosphaeria pertusa TaxID=390896 RepID=A0A6A6I0H0_9PLEO|nr:uncharacterized protein BU26DRAFT_523791 [Trematosphaeria pertusa]KAF2243498.1 hypothetical protein BU26DRAFT_523791 [Trematosphaeria pertusa]
MGPAGDGFDPECAIERDASRLPSVPALSSSPTAYPGCCLALSAPLLQRLCSLLPPTPSLTLSIGSGAGLLEALLLEHHALNLIGVDVHPTPNRYLPCTHHRTVPGTRFLEPLAANAPAWLFVYPRRVALVEEYLDAYGKGSVERVVWIGPRADWDDYKGCFGRGWHVRLESADELGGRAWELVAVARRMHA